MPSGTGDGRSVRPAGEKPAGGQPHPTPVPGAGRTSRPPAASGQTVRWSSAADRVAVVVNGNAKQVNDDLLAILDQLVHSGDLFVSRSLDEGRDIARTIVERGYPTVLTGGGDGTFVQMVTWVVHEAQTQRREPPRFGLLRLGTGNALAWFLGSGSARKGGIVADLARLRKEGGSRTMRLVQVEDTLTPFAGLGADAMALEHYQRTRDMFRRVAPLRPLSAGLFTYAIAITGRTLPELTFTRTPHIRIVNEGAPAVRLGASGRPVGPPIEPGEVVYEGPSRLAIFGTIPFWGFGARVFPYAEEREDRFSLRIGNFGALATAFNVKKLWDGSYAGPDLHDFLVERITIHCDPELPLEIGGDLIGRRKTVNIQLSERPIRLVDYFAPPPL